MVRAASSILCIRRFLFLCNKQICFHRRIVLFFLILFPGSSSPCTITSPPPSSSSLVPCFKYLFSNSPTALNSSPTLQRIITPLLSHPATHHHTSPLPPCNASSHLSSPALQRIITPSGVTRSWCGIGSRRWAAARHRNHAGHNRQGAGVTYFDAIITE